ncbi:MAG: AsmA family protein [Desulfobacterales bacterium]
MRWKWIATIGVLLIITLMVTGYVILVNYDYNKLKPRVAQMVKEVTGRELNLDGKIDLAMGFSPALTVSDVTFANASWGSRPEMIKIQQVQAQVRLLPLLSKDLALKHIGLIGVDVLLETDKTGRGNWDLSAEDSAAGKTGAFKFHNIDINKISIEKLNLRFHDGETGSAKRLALANLEVVRQGAVDSLALDLKADYNGQQLTLAGKIGLIHFLLAHERFPFELAGKFSNATVKINGAINDVLSLQGIDLQARISGTNLAELELGIGPRLPQTNAFDLTGHLKGSKEALVLEDLNGKLSGSAVDLVISGSFGDVIALSGMDLNLKGSGKNLAEVGSIVGEKLPATDEFAIDSRLTGSAKTLSLSEASGRVKRDNLNLTLKGKIEDLLEFSGVDLEVSGSGTNLTEIGTIIDQKLPATDVFTVQGRLTGSAKVLLLKDIRGSARRDNLSVALSGEVKDLIAFRGLDLQLKGSGKNLADIGSIVGEKLPATDEFALDGRLTGSTETLSLKNAQANARRGRLHLSFNGGVKNLLTLRGLDLQSKLTGTDLTEFGKIIGAKLPATDQFEIQGRLTGSVKSMALQKVSGRAKWGSVSLALKGEIMDLLDLGGMDLHFQGSGKDLAEIGSVTGKKLPATDAFRVRGRLRGSTKALSLLEAEGLTRRGGLNLTFNGEVKELLALEGINVNLNASGKELAEIGPLVGAELPNLGPFDMRGKLAGSVQAITLNPFSAILDKSDFNGLARVEFLKRPKITIRLESSVIDFTALMKSSEEDEQETVNKEMQKRRLFSDNPLPFDVLKKVDADILMKARNIHAKDARLEFGQLTLKLQDGDFSIDRLEATYRQTKISGNLHINSSSPPQVATKFIVQGLNLGELLKETGVSDQVRANLDIAAHLKSRGDSVYSLMANLDGSIGAVMGEGYLTRYLDLLSVGLTSKVIHFWGEHKKGGEIRCAVVQFDVNSGTATSKAFVFDTEAGVLTGEGDINLGTEKVNFLLVPKPRDLGLSFWTKLRVSGSVMDPKVRPDTLSLLSKGARALSALVVGPLGLLAPFVNLGAYKAHPCNVHDVGKP